MVSKMWQNDFLNLPKHKLGLDVLTVWMKVATDLANMQKKFGDHKQTG